MTDSSPLRETPLAEAHRALGAKMVPFAGYTMPVHYRDGIVAEHRRVRSDVGVFDVSHMGEFEVTGPDRNAFVNRVTCNDVSVLETGAVQYSAILNDQGTFIDDCTVYRFDDKLMLVVNAANRSAAWNHLVKLKGGANIRLKDISDEVGLLAVQGPRAEALMQPLTEITLSALGYYHVRTATVAGCGTFISRTGYTGEDGFEIYSRGRDLPVFPGLRPATYRACRQGRRGDGYYRSGRRYAGRHKAPPRRSAPEADRARLSRRSSGKGCRGCAGRVLYSGGGRRRLQCQLRP